MHSFLAPSSLTSPTQFREDPEINAGVADPTINHRLTDLGCAVFAGSPSEFGAFIASETDKWAKVIKYAGIKAG
jgi:tripartite-type tricarboxylate transporter receptor subunit TctC